MVDMTMMQIREKFASLEQANAELVKALEKISELDAAKDSEEGWNEWGEADCFRQAQEIARAALAKAKGETNGKR